MRKILTKQTALVTGATSGIGYGIARAMAEAGAAVAVNYYQNRDPAEKLAEEIRGAGGEAIPVKADVSKEDEVESMFAEVISRFGTVDIIVANAGIQLDSAAIDMSLAEWNRVLEVNLTGQFLCARAAVREFLRRGPQPDISAALGKIVCMSSVHEVIPWAGHVNYAVSKAGIMMLVKSAAQELAWRKIRINGIAPGAIRTAINRPVWENPETYQALLKLIPYQRIGEPDDVARAVIWLASDDSDYVNGTTLFADGGMLLYPGFVGNG